MRYSNGSDSIVSRGLFSQLIGVANCPCSDGKRRTVSRIGIPDTRFSAPGSVKVQGKTVTGFVSCDEDGYTFHAKQFGKNGNLLP